MEKERYLRLRDTAQVRREQPPRKDSLPDTPKTDASTKTPSHIALSLANDIENNIVW